MSAVRSEPAAREPSLRVMTVGQLDAVLAIEVQAYAFPWTRGNFIDSIAAGYLARVLVGNDGELIGYFVAMPGFEEMHLLNVTVSSRHEGQGHARRLLAELYALSASFAATAVWLEVRESNARARALYLRDGFTEAGRRRDYYPAPAGQREDAILMTRLLVREEPR
ncbi:ribosomal protein S18-alanine N-acetyltransferase [Scleromatobacter humisilvae]|uniref:[Ribosomal protein bS18]-alanine N-acetyltransferase n=1 Tax=Scleromatobacter humisilvae TaxID=2897159 RepID=A0A9X2BYC8_9BURK|nr:ribosomal protein S18-alanine N-acetyltransferase [Scleromatobacter humisilvae]MCK9685488.1 ribosomal protein S18-alanine N-acetyltransferase [Scleromatobacter humisilvae]